MLDEKKMQEIHMCITQEKKKNAIPEATLSLKQKYYLTNKDGGGKRIA